ncbi:MAG: hypothetical protein R3E90_01325 [Marinicella sp.]|nr:hypothetical protein [Xanthomonadales bacterium]
MNYFTKKTGLLVGLLWLLGGCGSEAGGRSVSQSTTGSFNIFIGGLFALNSQSNKAKAYHQDHNYWEFKNVEAKLRVSGRFESDDAAMQPSLGLIRNNVVLQFKHPETQQSVTCKPAQKPQGEIMRMVNNDDSSSGHLKVSFTECRITNTDTSATNIDLPLMVRGEFKNTPQR